MTTPNGTAPKTGLSLRVVVLVLCLAIAGYAVAVSAFLTVRLNGITTELQSGSGPMFDIYEDVTFRGHVLGSAAFSLHAAVLDGSKDLAGTAEDVRAALAGLQGRNRLDERVVGIPEGARTRLLIASATARALEASLAEILDLFQLNRLDRAAGRVATLDSLRVTLEAQLEQAHVAIMSQLVRRQEQLVEAATETTETITRWLLGSLLLLPLVVLVVGNRLWRPLRALERGLGAVADGDLHVEVPIERFDEIGRLTNHFNTMTDILRERAEEQGRFVAAGHLIAGVAHEVNNPLMAIATLAETRLEDHHLPHEVREELRLIVRQARRAGRLLSGLLRFVRPDSSSVSSTDLHSVCHGAVELVSYRFRHDEVTLEMEVDADTPPVQGDPTRIEQILVNLLTNALDALSEVEPPRILRLRTKASGDQVHLLVEDNGPGIRPALARGIFRPFTSTKGRRGTGLGLYISRQIMRDLGGELRLELSNGRGSRFVADFRQAAASSKPQGTVTVSPRRGLPRPALEGARILLVDDEDSIRRPLKRFLSGRGAEVLEASDGLEALNLLDRHQVDVVVADLKMPRLDGVKFYGRLVAERPSLAARTIFLTGDLAQLSDSTTAIDQRRVLIKPVKLVEIEERVVDILLSQGPGEVNPTAGQGSL